MLELADVLAKKLILITGKGGTGKSLFTASLALGAASRGKRVLVVDMAEIGQLAPLLTQEAQGRHVERQLAERLWFFHADPQRCFEDYVTKYLRMQRLYDTVFRHRVVRSFIRMIPGLAETMFLGRLFYTCCLEDNPYDLVLVDSPASGHFLQLAQTPQGVLDSGLLGPIVDEVARVARFLHDPKACGVLYMSLPEPLVGAETLDFVPQVQKTGLGLLGVCHNRSLAELPAPSPAAHDQLREFYSGRVVAEEQLRAQLHKLGVASSPPLEKWAPCPSLWMKGG